MLKKAVFFLLGIALLAGTSWAAIGYARKAAFKNVTLTTAGTVYNTTIPPGTGNIIMQSRTAHDFKISDLADASIYFTVKSGTVLNVSPVNVDQVIYMYGTNSPQVIEINYWQ